MKVKSIAQQLLFNTVPLELKNIRGEPIGSGTSFVISHMFENYGEELFLVTNKHVISNAWIGYLYFTEIEDGSSKIGKPFFIKMDGFEPQFHGHPSDEVDVAILPLSWQLDLIGKSGTKPYYTDVSTQMIPTEEQLEEIDVVKPIIFIGYPNGLYDAQNFTPITRTGMTATPVQLDFGGRPAFLIDASVFPGSSGSPVYSYDETWNGNITNPQLLGIVSEVMVQEDHGEVYTIPAPTSTNTFVEFNQIIDLGVVIKSHLIIETIEDFWKENESAFRQHKSEESR